MTRTEFDQKVREMKTQMANVIRPIQVAQAEIKEEIASKYRQINEIQKEISKLKQATQGYHQQRMAREAEWRKKINDFIEANEPSTTSNLAEANTLNIVYELRRRGFKGIVCKEDDETGDYESYDLNKTDWKHEE